LHVSTCRVFPRSVSDEAPRGGERLSCPRGPSSLTLLGMTVCGRNNGADLNALGRRRLERLHHNGWNVVHHVYPVFPGSIVIHQAPAPAEAELLVERFRRPVTRLHLKV